MFGLAIGGLHDQLSILFSALACCRSDLHCADAEAFVALQYMNDIIGLHYHLADFNAEVFECPEIPHEWKYYGQNKSSATSASQKGGVYQV